VELRGILLCGGASTRFGADKLLEVISVPSNERPGERMPMAAASARSYVSALDRVLAVTRPGQGALRALLEAQGCEVMETDRALGGLGESLAAGVEACAAADGWIVGLGDMPFIAPATVEAVRHALEKGALVAAPFSAPGKRGHPVGFAARLRAELLAISGDEGARTVIERHRAALVEVTVDDPGIHRDIDRREDLFHARE
jgi:molybdenum cofactor cytidylyltransferase